MPLINNKISQRKEKIKVEINSDTLAQINAYCQWASIDDIGFFIEEAAHFIFAKDKDFKAHQKAIKRQVKNSDVLA
ncbi:hypothetical protein [Legionella feeleii]|uniref:Uncharacterized protein n=1 Tax=Legionella feeleii TaxID=453 RepID=A0A0W0TH11_9GAMM|nr:hypothetical protein [Legionella feeleii]KTC94913.1 hypothetical protein Lfee_2577 [Legionella feeleii]SPX59813.1 Uncharacterised protein [Legionella feeleii]SPX59839.1 Uncharacterised protein [Legionella feeleii]